MRHWRFTFSLRFMAVLALVCLTVLTTAGDWPGYLHDPQHTAANGDDSIITPGNVTQLAQLWSFQPDSPSSPDNTFAAAATVVGGTAYIGSWDGYEYAIDANTGAFKWKQYLGMTSSTAIHCVPTSGHFGVTSTAAVQNGVVYVGGGDSYWYALDANTGAVLWKVYTGDNSQPGGHYNWSSPLIYNGDAYIGIASVCDKPLVQGELLQVDLSTHQIVNTFNVVPEGQVGGGIWSTPSVDSSTNTIFVTTGTQSGPNANAATQPQALAMVALDATTLALKASWQVPQSELTSDSDWSTTPTLFSDSLGDPLVAAFNKGGYLFTFNRNNIGAGPVWQQLIAEGGPCPTCGDASVSSSAFGNNRLFMAGNNTIINGTPCQGAVRALDSATGNILWEHCAPGTIVASPAYANGLVIDGAGAYVEVLDAATGARLYSYKTANAGAVYSISIANGIIYAGATDGNLYALGLPATPPTPTPTPAPDANCPGGWLCQDVGNATPAGSESASGATVTVNGGGANIAGTSDQFRFVAQGVPGDTQISAQIASQSSGDPQAKAGLMVRQSMDPAAPYYAAFLSPGNGLVVQYRPNAGVAATTVATNLGGATAPLYIEIQRTASDSFVTAVSSDGVNYTLVAGSQETVVMPSAALAGLAVTAHNTGALNSAAFTNVAIGAPGAPPATPSPPADPACPSGVSCQDIGNFVPAGGESFDGTTWTVQGGGQDSGLAYDEFHYVWQPITSQPISATVHFSAQVIAQSNANSQAKAGVMLRASADPAAAYYGAFVMPNGQVIVQYRLNQGYYMRVSTTAPGAPPLYLRVTRSGVTGTTFTADSSLDGVTWTHIPGSTVNFNTGVLGSTMLEGLAVTAHSATGALSTAQFTNANFTGFAPPTPTVTNTPGPTSTPTQIMTPAPTSTPLPTTTPAPPGGSGTYVNTVTQGGADSYTFTPGVTAQINVGSCAINKGYQISVALLTSAGTSLGSGGAGQCSWVSPVVAAGQTYTVQTTGILGSGRYVSAWQSTNSPVVWSLSGPGYAITTPGGLQSVSFPTLTADTINIITCGPAGASFTLSLVDVTGQTLASGTPYGNDCAAIAYQPSGRGLYHLFETAGSGQTGLWSGLISTDSTTGAATVTPTNTPAPTNTGVPTTIPTKAPQPTNTPTSSPTATNTPPPAPAPTTPPAPAPKATPVVGPPPQPPAPPSGPVQPAPSATPPPHSTPSAGKGPRPSGHGGKGKGPAPRGPLTGVYTGSIAAVGGASSYRFTPGASGTAAVGACAVSGGAGVALYVYDSDHVLVSSAAPAASCGWASLRVRAGRAYTVSTVALYGRGLYRSAWSVNGAAIIWNLGGALARGTGGHTFSVPVPRAGALSLAVCAQAGARVTLRLADAGGRMLAGTVPSARCPTLAYRVHAPGLFRLWAVTHGGVGAWSGTIKTE